MTDHEMTQEDPANQLTGTAPSGAKVQAVLEVSVCRPMIMSLHSARDPKGRPIVEFELGDESGCVYGAVVKVDGQTVYADTAGVLWTTGAITFKARDGTVLIQGDSAALPMADVDIEAAAEMNMRAQLLMREAGCAGRTERDWERVVAAQGWDANSELMLLRNLVGALGMWHIAAAYGQMCAREENGLTV